MIVGGYTLDLYCDYQNPAHAYGEFPHSFYHESGKVAKQHARKYGWKLTKINGIGIAKCPKCVKAGITELRKDTVSSLE